MTRPAIAQEASTKRGRAEQAGILSESLYLNDLGVFEFDGLRATFDGNGHTISNLLINRPRKFRVGFFPQYYRYRSHR